MRISRFYASWVKNLSLIYGFSKTSGKEFRNVSGLRKFHTKFYIVTKIYFM